MHCSRAAAEIPVLAFVGIVSACKETHSFVSDLTCLLQLLQVENVTSTWMFLYPYIEKAVLLFLFLF